VLTEALVDIFNESWTRGKLPKDWKRAEIIPIPKHAAASCVERLRPISLLSVVGKLMDKLVARRVSNKGEREGVGPTFAGRFSSWPWCL